MEITILDAIECEVSVPDGRRLIPCLSFESSYWKQGPYKKQRQTYMKQVFSFKGKRVWRFYTGLLSRILEWCKENRIPVEIIGDEFIIEPQNEPYLKGITFRDDQLKLITAACEQNRGVISSATGSGKTLMQLGIISCYPDCNFLILAHTVGIVSQTFEKLKQFQFKNIEMFGSGNQAQKPTARIAVATMQTFKKIDSNDYSDYYDGILLDESHHLQKMNSTYTKILNKMLAPIRIGFTATKRTTDEAILINEGLLGKTIEKVTIQEAADLGILATPKLKFIKAKCNDGIMDIRKFQDTYEKIRVNGKLVNGQRLKVGVYTYGITENKSRNRQVVEILNDFIKQNKSTLIFVTHIEHGNLIAEEAYKQFKYKIPFVQGSMPIEEREQVKAKLISGKLKAAIATVAWNEGIDIPNIHSVIIAGGGKSEIQTLQKLGRGLRKTEDKDSVTIVDFLDLSHFYLIRQTGERLATYSEYGFL
jgi:superfamily II DNA or RNA helicase